ncbi:50S ribosomal protein L27 [Candidatus Berkelbacteria bacterium CG_4_8_14_3_um_filter_33_6]|uniref:Large ribosomal subunit protein bL27 n=2 Tax=Candidatus Berkelbacteria TaxID=1618330 RepID=A0A2M7W3S6_9BACT|nr:MAG: 50S ribosomal protein L27 [Candidatus Berkelbacteria bacterium CG23_combo_of_CG06-09_8_20_14_all_33_15]PIS08295.1 MAG: 50S ribosomal protein L27 [Candidatus Berkelbacteria bacterium CG10_big_fil_rev_8_21_14_0_10_33_10]PIX31271.1 MAG: 50S ribosomal protein L27 [Candidatus Berkelbacteria bacterium CG_4_8_14_3_um_filter_33_6]PIZ28339.1 MAG: 50S ribosomal protein L27 [Candidatus Berkelbacteria bacterium CG_4_10_14_0_8_um_filter_35_9_33_8]PJA20237.1 MAG: 50S ribosomal protein L27 [Candidatus
MAHTKAKGSTKLGRESQSKRLGVKLFGGEKVKCGNILIRQRGSKWYAGVGVIQTGDDTLQAIRDGFVKFYQKRVKNFNHKVTQKTFISVVSAKQKI